MLRYIYKHAKLDCCNSLFRNLDTTQINRFQTIQTALAGSITKTPKHHHITPVPKSLQLFELHELIQYEILSLTYNTHFKLPNLPLSVSYPQSNHFAQPSPISC